MAFVGALDAFNSQPIQTKVGTIQTNIFTATSTKVTKDSSGKVNGGTTTVYYSANAGNYAPAATTTDGGKTWTYLKDANEKEILGTDAKISLERGALKTNTQQQILAATKKTPLGGGLSPEEQKIVAFGTQNTASPDPESPTPGSGETPKGLSEIKGDELNKGIDPINDQKTGITAVKQHGDYSYPSKMPEDMDKIKFNMYTYGIRTTKANFAGLNKDRGRGELKGSVTLGIQPRISDTNSVSWNDLSANALELAAAGASKDLITGGASAISDVLNKLGNTVGAEKSNIQEYAKTWFAGQAAGISGLTSRIGGVILNPNLELLFDGPQLRPFDFTFQLTPRDSDEAKAVKQIIRFFKQGMAVQRTVTELFLKAPNIFEIKYMFGQKEDHPGLNKIKRCALQSCSVDYTPTGSYMTFPDGTMTAYNITLSFKELEPVYSDEYEVGSNETVNNVRIGY